MKKMSLQLLEVAGHAINPKVRSVCSLLHKDTVSAQHLQRRGSFLKVRDHLGFFFWLLLPKFKTIH